MTNNVDQLVDNSEMRQRLVGNVNIFKDVRVKALASFLLDDDFGATTQQVADYFEVGISVIKMVLERNRVELENNGFKHYSRAEIQKSQLVTLENVPNRGMNIFTKRAILNIAMLLRDSEVAKQIRYCLLDIAERQDGKDYAEAQLKDLLYDIYKGGNKAVIASQKLAELESKEYKDGTDKGANLSQIVEEIRNIIRDKTNIYYVKLTTTMFNEWLISEGYGYWRNTGKKNVFAYNENFERDFLEKGFAISGTTNADKKVKKIYYRHTFVSAICDDNRLFESLVDFVKKSCC